MIKLKHNIALFATMMAFGVCSVFAEKSGVQIETVLSKSSGTEGTNSTQSVNSQPNSFVTFDFSQYHVESWDGKDSANNVQAHCFSGSMITGVEYNNVTIQTVSGSYLSEAVIYFSDSNAGDDGLRLVLGAGNEFSGTESFSSNGILDITDNGLSDVASLADGVFLTQFYEKIDDLNNSVDARYTSGTLKIHGIDLVANNNCMFVQGAEAGSDLSVDFSVEDYGDELKLHDDLQFNIVVTNLGSGNATNVVLNTQIGSNLKLQEFSCDDGTNTLERDAISSLSVQDIASSDSLNCVLSTKITSGGNIKPEITVTADNDIDNSNNYGIQSIAGVLVVVPVNNLLALAVLLFGIVLVTGRKNQV